MTLYVPPAPFVQRILFRIIGANMNQITDQVFEKVGTFNEWFPASGGAYRPSTSLTTAQGGVYTLANKLGTVIVPSTQTYTNATGAGTRAAFGIVASVGILTATPILSLTTGQGGAATADVFILGVSGPFS